MARSQAGMPPAGTNTLDTMVDGGRRGQTSRVLGQDVRDARGTSGQYVRVLVDEEFEETENAGDA